MTTILHLPSEVFLEILGYAHARLFAQPVRISPYSKERKPEQDWVCLLHVCHRWRSIILEEMRFWRTVNVYRRPDWLKFCLSHVNGKNTPLRLNFRDASFPPSQLPLLSRHQIYLHALDLQVDSKWVPALRALFRSPLLVAILSVSRPSYEYDHIDGDIGLSAGALPRLQILTLAHLTPPNDVLLYAKLRALDLSSCKWSIVFDRFVTLLRACPNLERLALDHALSHITGVPDHPQATSARVTLPRLRTLSLHHPLDLNARILACLTTPAVSRVELSDNTSDTDHDDVLNRSHTFAAILPPNRAAILPAALPSSSPRRSKTISLAAMMDKMRRFWTSG
ncbi:hypothetical protein C8Q76DRAFT_72056 [Earliella scabrosa]|nr:hypothetical protein C8Q76DRAFT_72056 [Earliella scabrosa]